MQKSSGVIRRIQRAARKKLKTYEKDEICTVYSDQKYHLPL